MRPPLSLIPLMPVAIAIAAGIFICSVLPYEWMIPTGAVTIAAVVALALTNLRQYAIIAGACGVGMVAYIVADGRGEANDINGQRATARGTVTQQRMSNAGQVLTVRLTEWDNGEGIIRRPSNLYASVIYPSFSPEIEKGEEVVFTSTFSPIVSNIHLPDETDIAAIMHDRGIRTQTLVKPDSLTYIAGNNTLYARVARMGRMVTEIILHSPLSTQAKEFLATTVAGQSDSLTNEMRDSFTRSGLAHVLALSGLHVGIVIGVVMILLLPMRLTPARRLIPATVIITVWGFALVTGLSASVTRASVMATVMLCAMMLQRRHSPFNALCLAAILILLSDPGALYNTGFILSFMAVTGILIFAEKLNPVSRRNRLLHPIGSAIAVTTAAMLATGMVSVYKFHSFPVYFLVANIAVMPLLPLIVGGGVIMVACGAAGWYPEWICSTLDTLCGWLSAVTDWVGNLPGATIDDIYLRAPEMVCGITAIIAMAIAIHTKRRMMWMTTAILTICSVALILIPEEKTGFGVRIVSTAYRTDLIASSPEALDIITTASEREYGSIKEDAALRYRDHLGQRGIDTIRVSNREASNSVCRFSYPLIETATHRIIIANNDSLTLPQRKVDMLLVCRGFRGDIVGLASAIRPDSILLSTDLTPLRRNRYEAECKAAGLAVRNLAINPYLPESCL